MLRLDSALSAELLVQPESGMGYQIVEATAFARLLNEAKISAEIKSLRVVAHTASVSSAFALRESATRYGRKATPARDGPVEQTKEKEVFKRFTAYENDRRITSDGKLLPGTYATTEADA